MRDNSMNRGLKSLITLVAATIAFVAGSARAEEGKLAPAGTRVDNIAAVQRGARLYFNYCSGCHSVKYMRYSRIAEDLKLSETEVLSSFAFSGGKIGDLVTTNMPAGNAETWFGKTPPDLSLEARAKGADWIYTYLKSFYLDPSRPTGWNNLVFPNVSMPNVLWELQGTQRTVLAPAKAGEEAHVEKLEQASPGKLSPAAFDDAARDLTAFLEYAGEPAKLKREAMGVWVVLYLGLFTFLAWLLKHEYWKDVH
jgi:ubiquinol-cytochrome c reductase cytochrome c1 subunit